MQLSILLTYHLSLKFIIKLKLCLGLTWKRKFIGSHAVLPSRVVNAKTKRCHTQDFAGNVSFSVFSYFFPHFIFKHFLVCFEFTFKLSLQEDTDVQNQIGFFNQLIFTFDVLMYTFIN